MVVVVSEKGNMWGRLRIVKQLTNILITQVLTERKVSKFLAESAIGILLRPMADQSDSIIIVSLPGNK